IDRKGAVLVTPSMQARRLALELGLTPTMLPPTSGFQLSRAWKMDPEGKQVLAQMYSGDAGRFTLFQLRGELTPSQLQRMARGRLSTYSWKLGTESFAIVGELPDSKLREIAKILGDRYAAGKR